MNSWFFLSLGAVAIWGVWGLFGKLASASIDGRSVFFYQLLTGLAVVLLLALVTGFRPATNPRGVFWAVLTGLASAGGQILFFIALSRGKASVIVAMTAFYPVVTVLLAFLVLRESITLYQGLGMAFAMAAIGLFAL